jgi:hypothetical protein
VSPKHAGTTGRCSKAETSGVTPCKAVVMVRARMTGSDRYPTRSVVAREVVRQGLEDKLMTIVGDIRGCGMEKVWLRGRGEATVGEGALDADMAGANDGHAGVRHAQEQTSGEGAWGGSCQTD